MSEPPGEIRCIRSPAQLAELRVALEAALRAGALHEVPPAKPYRGSWLFTQRWFRAADGNLWRLIEPDPPDDGVYERVLPEPTRRRPIKRRKIDRS